VVDVRDDREVADVTGIHTGCELPQPSMLSLLRRVVNVRCSQWGGCEMLRFWARNTSYNEQGRWLGQLYYSKTCGDGH
jgi:hypothetical protein